MDEEKKEEQPEKFNFKGTKCRVPGCLICGNENLSEIGYRNSKEVRMKINNN